MLYNPIMKANLVVQGLFICFIATAGYTQQQPTVKKVAPKPTVSISGKDLFQQYCAACHGADGKGTGPAAPAMKTPPTDLTQISRKNNGRFPEERIQRMLLGDEPVTAHGSGEMPVWGSVFHNMTNNLGLAQTRIHALIQYLDDLQAK